MRTLVAAVCLLSVGLLAVSCETSAERSDLRENPRLYRNSGYSATVPVDRAVFIAPMIDKRSMEAAEASGPYPLRTWPESVWDAPLSLMISDVVRDEIESSGVFTEVVAAPGPQTLILTPYLLSAFCGEEERQVGRRSIGEVALRFVVHGVGTSPETRGKVFDRTFPESAATPVAMSPPDPVFNVGIALRKSILRSLQALDQSNVSRSAVPMDPEISGIGTGN